MQTRFGGAAAFHIFVSAAGLVFERAEASTPLQAKPWRADAAAELLPEALTTSSHVKSASAAAPLAFAELDLNGDGVVSPSEFQAATSTGQLPRVAAGRQKLGSPQLIRGESHASATVSAAFAPAKATSVADHRPGKTARGTGDPPSTAKEVGTGAAPAAEEELPEDLHGSKVCRCVAPEFPERAYAGGGRTATITLDGKTVDVKYPDDIGSYCKAWDDGKYPGSCEEPSQIPGMHKGWCAARWCYVDPCECGLEPPPYYSYLHPRGSSSNSFYLPGATYKNRSLYYSYVACGTKDEFAKDDTVYGCADLTEEVCKLRPQCGWTGKLCLIKELFDLCKEPDTRSSAMRCTAGSTAWRRFLYALLAAGVAVSASSRSLT
eukprot:TRINITY_DN82504_c0_g1_i1.p1 TRINITY_DN82504_c0_g1~~TRINITY_DN82504_c0_g1_i1.p1  ORF type:complete len:378 (+),score=74.49 TRINITY_DN82504_c0_g1_i1:79-1212(+)